MDPYRYGPPSGRYGSRHDLSLLAVFLLTILLMGSVVAVLTAGTLWQPPELPSFSVGEQRSSNLFGASGGDDRSGAGLPDPAGVLAGAETESSTPTPEPTATAEATATTEPPAPTAEPSPSATPEVQRFYVIGNTGGVGAWLRRSPRMNDYLIAWPDNTRMEVIGPDVEAEGHTWRNVRDPRGNRGYLPAEWLIPTE